MATALARRIIFAGLAAWVLVMAAQQFRLTGHATSGIGLCAIGVVLAGLAITSKGG